MIPKHAFASDETNEEFNKITEMEKTIDREKLVYESNKSAYNFRNFRTIGTFGGDIYNGEIT